MQHGWISRRQADQTGILLRQPSYKCRVQFISDFSEPSLILNAAVTVNQ